MNARKAVIVLGLLCPVFLFAQIGSPLVSQAGEAGTEQKCLLQGRVINSVTEEPVKKASVRLSRRGAGGPAKLFGNIGGATARFVSRNSNRATTCFPGNTPASWIRNTAPETGGNPAQS